MTLISITQRPDQIREVLAVFGSARLVRRQESQLELRGGTAQERSEAREWASLFLSSEYVNWNPSHGR